MQSGSAGPAAPWCRVCFLWHEPICDLMLLNFLLGPVWCLPSSARAEPIALLVADALPQGLQAACNHSRCAPISPIPCTASLCNELKPPVAALGHARAAVTMSDLICMTSKSLSLRSTKIPGWTLHGLQVRVHRQRSVGAVSVRTLLVRVPS